MSLWTTDTLRNRERVRERERTLIQCRPATSLRQRYKTKQITMGWLNLEYKNFPQMQKKKKEKKQKHLIATSQRARGIIASCGRTSPPGNSGPASESDREQKLCVFFFYRQFLTKPKNQPPVSLVCLTIWGATAWGRFSGVISDFRIIGAQTQETSYAWPANQ